MNNFPKTPAGKLEFWQELVKTRIFSEEEMLALLEGLTLQEYQVRQTLLGKFLAGTEKEED